MALDRAKAVPPPVDLVRRGELFRDDQVEEAVRFARQLEHGVDRTAYATQLSGAQLGLLEYNLELDMVSVGPRVRVEQILDSALARSVDALVVGEQECGEARFTA